MLPAQISCNVALGEPISQQTKHGGPHSPLPFLVLQESACPVADRHHVLHPRRGCLSSNPIAEELDLAPHTPDGYGRAKTQDAAQLLANREPRLRDQNHAGVLSPGTDPLRVKSIEIGDVERVEDTPTFRGEGQLFLVRLLGEAGVQSRDHCDTTRTKSRDKIAVHRVFVDLDLDLAHQ